MASSESQARLTQTEPAKWIVVYKNGDQHFAGRRMVVKPREIKTFDHLLEEVTLKLSPSFGAVRNIFTPEGGTRVASLTELKPNGKYVASPNEPFRQLSRTRYGEIPIQSTGTSQSRVSLQPVRDKQVGSTGGARRLHTVPSRYRESAADEITIHVYRNGDAFTAASPLRVDRVARSYWQQTLARLGEKLRIGRGVHKLYSLKGQLVRDPASGLEHNGLYVAAADNDSFRLVNYGASREPFRSVARSDSRGSTPHLPCPHQRITESAPTVGPDSPSSRLAAPPSTSTPPMPPLRVSYPQLARRCSQLRDKCALREQAARRQAATDQESDRNCRSLHQSLHQPAPRSRSQLPRPPPRGAAVAPIDVGPDSSPGAAESDRPFSYGSSSTDEEDEALMRVLSPELCQPERSRLEPFYLHPLPETGEETSVGRGDGRSRGSDDMERRLGSSLMSADVERRSGDSKGSEDDVYIATDGPNAPPPDLASSYSSPHLSRPPSQTNISECTPSPTEPIMARSHLIWTKSGFRSSGPSPPPGSVKPARIDTPRTPPFDVTFFPRQPSGTVALGGGSRPASRATSEPRLDSRLSGATPQPAALVMMADSAGQLRCVSVMSCSSSVLLSVTPASPGFLRPLMRRAVSSETLRAPESRGESPMGVSSVSTTPVSTWSEADEPVTPTAENWVDVTYSAHSSLTLPRGASSSSQTRVREEPSSSVNGMADRHVASACEDSVLPCSGDDASLVVDRSRSALSADFQGLAAPARGSPVTPELRRPLLAPTMYRGLVTPPGELPAQPEVSSVSGIPRAARSEPTAQFQGSAPPPSSKAASIEQMPDWSPYSAQPPSNVVRGGESVLPDLAPASPPAPPLLPEPPSVERGGDGPGSPAGSESSVTESVSPSSHVSGKTTESAVSSERKTEPPTEREAYGPPQETGKWSTPPPVSLEERSGPVPLPRHQRSVPEGSPLSWSGTAVSTGWLWDEIPARPVDRKAMAARGALPAPPAAAVLAPPPAEESGRHASLPIQPIWPPTRTNTPEQAIESPPEDGVGATEPSSGFKIPEAPQQTAELQSGVSEPVTATERGPEALRVSETPAGLGQKLDEIASLLRTLLLQNASVGRAGGGGAAPPLGGLDEEQLRALLQPEVADRAATGDSPPHKLR